MNYYLVLDYIPKSHKLDHFTSDTNQLQYAFAISIIAGDQLDKELNDQRYRRYYLDQVKKASRKACQELFHEYAKIIRSEVIDMYYYENIFSRIIESYDEALTIAGLLIYHFQGEGFKDIQFIDYEGNYRKQLKDSVLS